MTTNWRPLRDTVITTLAGAVLTGFGLYATTAAASTPAPSDSDRVGEGICVKELPPEAHDTIKDIERGGPYDYPGKDGSVFENRDDNPLPRHKNGYYHEFTVRTPGLDHRGAKRIVTGGDISDKKEDYYTEDHYETFDMIKYKC